MTYTWGTPLPEVAAANLDFKNAEDIIKQLILFFLNRVKCKRHLVIL